jgi:hypothetical protein
MGNELSDINVMNEFVGGWPNKRRANCFTISRRAPQIFRQRAIRQRFGQMQALAKNRCSRNA